MTAVQIEIPKGYELKYPEVRKPKNGEYFLETHGSVKMADFDYTSALYPILKEKAWVPDVGQKYYMPVMRTKQVWMHECWNNDRWDKQYYERGLVCKTEEEAIELTNVALEAIKNYRKETKGEAQ